MVNQARKREGERKGGREEGREGRKRERRAGVEASGML